MEKPEFGKAVTNIVNFPIKLLGWVLQQLVVWTLRLGVIISALVVVFFLFSCVWLGFFIHRNLDRPMTYTPVPVSPQPPEGLTFRQFYQGVKGYYLEEDASNSSKFIQKYGYVISLGGTLPFTIIQMPRDAWVLTHPDSFLKSYIPQKDYHRFIEPLEAKIGLGTRDFQEAMWLEIEASYWYWDHDRFLTYYQAHPEAFQ